MSDDHPVKTRRLTRIIRIVRRTATLLAVVLVIGIVVVAVGTAGVWGHFWNFRVGDPTAETCGNCHVMESYVQSVASSEILAGAHTASDITCTDCHDYGLDQQINDTVAYFRSDYQQPLEQARYEMDFCFQCHEHGSYDQIAWRTMDLGVTDGQAKGHDANPHQSPHYDELECNVCHRVHTPSTLYCWECHTYDFGDPRFVREPLPEATPELTPEIVPEATSETPPAN